jgi:hypothetical protein
LTTTVEGKQEVSVDPNKIALRFHSDGGRYLYKAIVDVPAVTGDSWKEIIVAGFTIYSYVETEGESSESEYVFQEKFTTVGDNIVPAAGSGWDVYDDGVLLTKGSNGSGASSRVFSLSATNLPAALYIRMLGTASKYYAVYGNGGDGEPTLELDAVKYQFTYYAVNWNSDLRMLYFQLLDAEDNVVYSREDSITPNISNKNTVVDAQKIEFKFTPSAAGQYKLKFWVSGEAMFGNISIMTVGSPATYWKNLLATAVVAAQDEYTLATQDIFAGKTYDALGAAIAKYADPDMHTPAAYEAAIAEVEGLTKAMSTRRSAVSAYTTNLNAAADALANAEGTKYAALDAYTDLSGLYTQYQDVTAQQLEDDDLIAANTALSTATALLSNMQSECVGLLTAQLASLAAQIVKLDDSLTDNETVLAAGNALTDDQDLAKLLKLKLTSILYKKLANEEDPFNVYDEEYEQTVADSIDLTGFIQNADLYTTSLKRDGITDMEGLFPGWTVTMLKENQSVAVQFSWSTFNGSATHPVTDAGLIGSWGPSMTIAQTLDIVPVGVYSISAGTEDSGDRVSDADSAFVRSTFQYAQASKTDTMLFRNDDRGTYYDLTRAIFPNVEVPAVEGQQYGSLTPSATIRTYQSICEVDAFKLHITGKLAGFDYAAAAAAVEEEYIATGIDRTTLPTEAPVAVRYYNLAGQPLTQAAGLCIKMERYANGFIVVKKIVVK